MSDRISRIKPVDRESAFQIDDIFFSTTDLIGNITSGNSTFVRISQYTQEELMGAAHNIIRHPDMPRGVFKLLWEYLKAKKSIVAYVKNMSKEGLYYWVVAAVFPVAGGYLSIRIKPTSAIFSLIPNIYNKMLKEEESGGIEASQKFLLETLASKGFESYDAFMSTVLVEELNARERLIKAQAEMSMATGILDGARDNAVKDRRALVEALKDIRSLCQGVSESFTRLFKDFDNLLKVDQTLKSTSTSVLNFSEQISILSLNVNINSYFAGEAGRTLSVVSKTINIKTEEIESFTQAIVKCSNDISKHTLRLGFQTSTPRLQIAMVNAFIEEIYAQSLKRDMNAEELLVMKNNVMVLIDLFMGTFAQLANILFPIGGKIKDILNLIESINSSIYELERCNFLGNIEAAVIGEKGLKFNFTFGEIKESTEATKQSLLEFRRYLNGVMDTTTAIQVTNTKIVTVVHAIKEMISTIK